MISFHFGDFGENVKDNGLRLAGEAASANSLSLNHLEELVLQLSGRLIDLFSPGWGGFSASADFGWRLSVYELLQRYRLGQETAKLLQHYKLGQKTIDLLQFVEAYRQADTDFILLEVEAGRRRITVDGKPWLAELSRSQAEAYVPVMKAIFAKQFEKVMTIIWEDIRTVYKHLVVRKYREEERLEKRYSWLQKRIANVMRSVGTSPHSHTIDVPQSVPYTQLFAAEQPPQATAEESVTTSMIPEGTAS